MQNAEGQNVDLYIPVRHEQWKFGGQLLAM